MSVTTVLFDAPGPKARARHRILTIIGAVLIVLMVVIVVRKFYQAGQLDPSLWKPFITDPSIWKDYFLIGLVKTVQAAALSIFFAGIFGVLAGMGRLAPSRWIRMVSGAIVEFFRAVPVLIMMLFLGAGGGFLYTLGVLPDSQVPLAAVVTALTLYNGSVIAELVRSGVHGLPKGQGEAGLSIGLTPAKTLTLIQLPQALRNMLPALIGQLVVALKDSALGYAILYKELLSWAKSAGAAYGNVVPAYIVAALLFILLNYGMTVLANRVEKSLRSKGGGATNAAAAAEPEAVVLGTKSAEQPG